MITIRHADERGAVDLGWLQSRHSFSFGSYHDPRHMGVSALRVINDDRVAPGAGFDTHSHRDMEIISYVTCGAIEHRDSMGHVERLPAGEFQLMSAGTGVTHSEYNPSRTDPLEFLQIWIVPDRTGLTPGYQQKHFERCAGATLVASPDGAGESLRVHQDVHLYRVIPGPGDPARVELAGGRTAYVHVVRGELEVNGAALAAGDGATLRGVNEALFLAQDDAEALVFDLP